MQYRSAHSTYQRNLLPTESLAALLRSCSWRAEKIYRARGRFDLVLWIAEHADGQREVWETLCDNAPEAASDAEILDHLAAEMRAEFAKRGVVRFAVAYAANRVTVSRPVEQTYLLQPAEIRRAGVMLEAHGDGEHSCAFREILKRPRQPTLAAPEPLTPGDSRYASMLGQLV